MNARGGQIGCVRTIEQIVNQSTKVGDSVLDLFGGSGVMLEACLKLKRFIHTMDISDDSINRMLKIAQSYTQKSIDSK